MLLFISITVVLQFALTNAFLEKCPLDRTQRVDNDVAVDILQDFYNDLIRVEGIVGLGLGSKPNKNFTDEHTKGTNKVLKDVHQFVWDVDKKYGIKKSPNLTLLAAVHASMKDELAPWHDIRAKVLNMDAQRAKYPSDDDEERLDLSTDTFSHALFVAKEHVDRLLCEFVDKLRVLGLLTEQEPESSKRALSASWPLNKFLHRKLGQGKDYSEIVGQLKSLDFDYAKQLNRMVVRYVDINPAKALEKVDKMCTDMDDARAGYDWKQSFTKWFRVDIKRRLPNACDAHALDLMHRDLHDISYIRSSRAGISMRRMIEQDAKQLFHTMKCLHQKLDQVN